MVVVLANYSRIVSGYEKKKVKVGAAKRVFLNTVLWHVMR